MAQSVYLIDLNKYLLGGKLFKYKGVLNIVKIISLIAIIISNDRILEKKGKRKIAF